MRRALVAVGFVLLLQACDRAPPVPVSREQQGKVTPPVDPPKPPAPIDATRSGEALLAAKKLVLPVEGVAASQLQDTYGAARGDGRHEAIDILAPLGTPVYAVDDGPVAKLFLSKPGGITLYQFDPQGQLAYYYAHLDRYADGMVEGKVLKRGELLGYVGTSGNTRGVPHLHFAVFRLGPEKQWWKGEPVNPYPALRTASPR